MKKIFGLVLALVMLVTVLAVIPVAAEDNDVAVENFALYLDSGINLVFLMEDGTERIVPVAAKEMGNEITVGNEGFRVSWAAESYMDSEYSEATQKLAEALLNYGAAAQLYFNYNTDELVGEPVTDTTALKGADVTPATVTDEAGIFIGATLILEGTMKLRFYFEGTEITATVDDEAATATAENGYSYVDVDVMPYNISKAVTVKVGNTTVTYAPINYLKNKADDTALSTMVASIYAYGVAAEAYYAEASACKHEGIFLEVISPATMLYTGTGKNVCPDCDFEEDVVIEKTSPKTEVFTTSKHDLFGEKVKLTDALDKGEHFYPTPEDPEGNDLYVEFSVLWNSTMLNYKGLLNSKSKYESYFYMGMFGTKDGTSGSSSSYQTSYHFTLGTNCPGFWCKHIGGFEPTENKYNVMGPSMADGGAVTDFPNIGEYGWHRVGYRFHQTTTNSNGTAKHTITVYVYIDGVCISGYKVIRDQDNSYANLLYTAEYKNGNISYTGDVNENTYMWAFEFAKDATASSNMYFTYADVFVTAGDNFVMPVMPNYMPESGAYSPATGVELNAPMYFQLYGEDKCTHKDSETVTTTVATVFSEGTTSSKCNDCGKTIAAGTIAKTTASIEVFTPGDIDSAVFGEKYNIVNDVLKGDHFYPTPENPNGKSMYVEFSVLWNETLKNVENGKDRYAQFGTLGDSTASSNGTRVTPFFLIFNETKDSAKMWCQFAGGFETDNNTTNTHGNPVVSDKPEDYYSYIGDYGWHRIGIEYTQVTELKSGKVYYTLYGTLYVDGVKVLGYQVIKTTDSNNKNLLYTAENVNGSLGNFKDCGTDRYVFAYRFGINHEANNNNAYFVAGDISVTCGTGFVVPVEPATNPTGGTYSPATGVNLDATVHFQPKNN